MLAMCDGIRYSKGACAMMSHKKVNEYVEIIVSIHRVFLMDRTLYGVFDMIVQYISM